MPRPEQSDIGRRARKDLFKPRAILLIAVRHQDRCVIAIKRPVLKAVCWQYGLRLWEAAGLCPLHTAVEDVYGPAKERAHAHHGLRIVTRTEDKDPLRRHQALAEGTFGRSGEGFAAEHTAAMRGHHRALEGNAIGRNPRCYILRFAVQRGRERLHQRVELRCVCRLDQNIDGAATA